MKEQLESLINAVWQDIKIKYDARHFKELLEGNLPQTNWGYQQMNNHWYLIKFKEYENGNKKT